MPRLAQQRHHTIDSSIPAIALPHCIYGGIDQAPLGVVEAVFVSGHLRHEGLEHRHAVNEVILVFVSKGEVDHPKGVDRDA